MASVKGLAEIPSLLELYGSAALRKTPSPAATLSLPSSAINSRVGLICGDITKLRLDAIVNAANTSLCGGGGVDGAIHRAAGPGLLAECRDLGGCQTGKAKMTGGHRLPAKNVIHTVGPIYSQANPHRCELLLRSCYQECLDLAAKNSIRTLAFCSISTGVYGYPTRDAAQVACETVRKYLEADTAKIERIVFVTFDQTNMAVYEAMLP